MSYFIATVTDSEDLVGKRVDAFMILQHRLDNNIWGLHKFTKNRKNIKIDSGFVFYIAGEGRYSQHFVASAIAAESPSPFPLSDIGLFSDIEHWLYENPYYKIPLRDVKIFNRFVNVFDIKGEMDLFQYAESPKWGALLQGGIIRLSDNDFNMIVKSSS